mgnify:FL=1
MLVILLLRLLQIYLTVVMLLTISMLDKHPELVIIVLMCMIIMYYAQRSVKSRYTIISDRANEDRPE